MIGIDKETLALIQTTAQQAKEAKLVPVPGDPERHLLIGNGTHVEIATPRVPPPRRHTVETLADFAQAYKRWCADSVEAAPNAPPDKDGNEDESVYGRLPNVWVDFDQTRILFHVDEPLRRSWVKLDFALSEQWKLLARLKDESSFDQKQLVRLLRHHLAGCVDPLLVAVFRSLDFQKIERAKRDIEHQKQSLDSDLQATVTAAGGPIPETLLVRSPVFVMRELAAFQVGVRLSVDVDTSSGKISLQAMPGDLDTAREEARRQSFRVA